MEQSFVGEGDVTEMMKGTRMKKTITRGRKKKNKDRRGKIVSIEKRDPQILGKKEAGIARKIKVEENGKTRNGKKKGEKRLLQLGLHNPGSHTG